MEEVPLLKDLAAKYSKTAAVIGVSIDVSLPRVDRTVKEKGMTYPILADGKGFEGPIPAAYHVQGTPDIFVLDADGRIVKRLGSATEVEAALEPVLRTRRQ
jgi:peroxiredoxin